MFFNKEKFHINLPHYLKPNRRQKKKENASNIHSCPQRAAKESHSQRTDKIQLQ